MNPLDDLPYLGLRPFTENEHHKFFGRSREIHILTEKILAHRLSLLVAASGVGKSSLLQAGVMPALRASGRVDLIYHNDWALHPANALKQSIAKHFIAKQRVNPDYQPDLGQPLVEFIGLHSLLADGVSVVLLDQFEEFFHYQRFRKQGDEFIAELARAIQDQDSPTAFVISMREDFAMELQAFKPYLASIFDNIYRIEKLDLSSAELAITEPLKPFEMEYEPGLLDLLLKELGQRERIERLDLNHLDQEQLTALLVEPPHLQIVCQELWQAARSTAAETISLELYQQLGAASGILKHYFGKKMALLGSEQQRLASKAFDLLVSQHGAKMSYPLVELATILVEEADVLRLSLDELEKAAVLRRLQRDGQPWYELYHDIFAKSVTEWNQAYKRKQLRKRLVKNGVYTLIGSACLFVVFDTWQNYSHRFLSLGKESVSERVEVYQGDTSGLDLFRQRHFLYETDFERLAIEADKRFVGESAIADTAQIQATQIGQLPLQLRFKAYAEVGLFAKADEIFVAVQKSQDTQLTDSLADDLTNLRIEQSIDRLLALDKHRAIQLLETIHVSTAAPKLIALLRAKDSDSDVRGGVTQALGHLRAQAAVPDLIALLKDKNVDSDTRRLAANALGQLQAHAAIPDLIAPLQDKNVDIPLLYSVVQALGELQAQAAVPELVALLKDKNVNSDLRRSVATNLGVLQAQAAVPELIALLKDKGSSPEVRAGVAQALGELRAQAAFPDLIALLKDKNVDSRLRNSAAQAIGELRAQTAFPNLVALLKDKDVNSDLRRRLAQALGKLLAQAGVPDLIAVLKDNNVDSGLRRSAAYNLGALQAQAAVPDLIALLNNKNSDFDLRRSVAQALGELRSQAAVPDLIALLKDKNVDIRLRNSAAQVLGGLRSQAAVPELIALLKDKDVDSDLRHLVAQALGELRSQAAIPELIGLLKAKDHSPEVRNGIAQALGEMQAQTAVPDLIALLKDKDNGSAVRSGVVQALGDLQAQAAVPDLIVLLKDKNVDIDLRNSAAQALGELRAQAAVPDLIAQLKDKNVDSDLRRHVAQALGVLRAQAAVPDLIAQLKDKNVDSELRNSAAQALGELRSQAAVPDLIAQLKDRNADIDLRNSAAQVLGELRAQAAVPDLIALLKDKNEGNGLFNSAAQALGELRAQAAAPELISILEQDTSPDVVQALGRMRQQSEHLPRWQAQQLQQLVVPAAASQDLAKIAYKLAYVYAPQAIPPLVGFLADENPKVVIAALESLGRIGETHFEWLAPHVDTLIKVGQQQNLQLKQVALSTLGNLIHFESQGEFNVQVQQIYRHLLSVVIDSKQDQLSRIAALKALGGSVFHDQAGADFHALLQEPSQSELHPYIIFWLAKLSYQPALDTLQQRLADLMFEKQEWRRQRVDAEQQNSEDTASLVFNSQADKSWRQDHEAYQLAYAIACIGPKTAGVALLNHPSYAARQAAIFALAEQADGDLIRLLLEHHQAFNPKDLPSPDPYTTYQALDKALWQVEITGQQADLDVLKKLKPSKDSLVKTQMLEQQGAINERLDWTIDQLSLRLLKDKVPS